MSLNYSDRYSAKEGGKGGKIKGAKEWQGMAEKCARTDKSDTETEAGGDAGISQSQYNKGHMTSIYLMDSEGGGLLWTL